MDKSIWVVNSPIDLVDSIYTCSPKILLTKISALESKLNSRLKILDEGLG